MKIRLTIGFEITRGKRGAKEVDRTETPAGLDLSGSTTEIRSQPSYLGFTIPGEEV